MKHKNTHNDKYSDIGEGKNRNSSNESITLRFDKTTMNELRNEAEQKMESVNTLLNQIVKSYTKWHKPARMAGLIYINKFLYRDIVEHLTEEQIKSIA